MHTTNRNDSDTAPSRLPRSTSRWVMTGFLIGASIPVACGIYGLYNESVYAASLPAGTGRCGMGTFAAWTVAVVGGPVFGMVGGLVGWIASRVRI